PRIAQWFSGNIGFHHIHHLSPRIPNYNLERCHKADPMFRKVKPLTLHSSLRSLTYRLWDEQRRVLVGYRRLRELRREKQLRPQGDERIDAVSSARGNPGRPEGHEEDQR